MDVSGARWRKSSFSGDVNNGNGCVEVAFVDGSGNVVALRDSKDRSRAPHVFQRAEWAAFLAGVRAGEFEPAQRR